MDTFIQLADLAFKFVVFIYLVIVTIRCTIVGIYNCTLGNDELNPLKVENVHYDNFFILTFAWVDVLCLHWKIWGPENMLYKVGDIVNEQKHKRTG